MPPAVKRATGSFFDFVGVEEPLPLRGQEGEEEGLEEDDEGV
jgi:hypothetical protein